MQANKLKILHVNNYAGRSGADLVYRTTVDALNDFGTCSNKTANIAAQGSQEFTFSDWQSRRGLGKLRYIYSPENRVCLSEYLDRYRPDILHAHGFYSAISPSILTAIRQAKKQWGMSFVQTAHSHELICANASAYDYASSRICTDCKGSRLKLKIFYRNCDRRGWIYSWIKGIRCFVAQVLLDQVKLTDKVICPSELMVQNLIEEGLAASKLSLVRNPVSVPRAELEHRRKEVVYFGRLSPEKNLMTLLDAFLEFHDHDSDWRLILIGEGEDKHKLLSRIKQTASEDCVELLPFMDQASLYERISHSQIMVMTSNVLENSPLVIPEALMCGLYPIVPDHGGMKEAIGWLDIGDCYEAGNQSSLCDALIQAVRVKSLGSKLSQVQSKIEKELSAQSYVEQMMEIYERLAS